MPQPKITAFANETLDKVFIFLEDKSDWLALIKTHRSFKASAQRLFFRDLQVPAQRTSSSPGCCSMLLRAITANPHLADSVRTLQIDCRLENAYPYGDLLLERDSIRDILAKLPDLRSLTIFVVEQPASLSRQTDAASEIAQMLRPYHNTPIIISCPDRRLSLSTWLFSLPSAKTLFVRANYEEERAYPPEEVRLTEFIDFTNLTTVDFTSYCRDHFLAKIGTATRLQKLRFMWRVTGWVGLDVDFQALTPVRHTLRELTILPDVDYEMWRSVWGAVNFSTFTALEVLRIPSHALFQQYPCHRLQVNPDHTGFKHRGDITHFLPLNVRHLELWFEYPSGIFAVGGPSMRQFQELGEPKRVRYFDWILSLLQLRSLRQVRMSEGLCFDDKHWPQKSGDRSMYKFVPPDVVSSAFCKAGVELEIEGLDSKGVYHGMY